MKRINEINQYFQELEAQDLFSGVVLITRGDQEIFAETFGYACRAWKIRNTLDTRFDTASITKLFTAVSILQLIDQKRLSFDIGVVDFLNLEGSAISREVNVFHLLTHTSGIGDDADEEAGESYEELWKTRPNYMVNKTKDFLPQFVHKPSNFPPGQTCRYNNCGYVLLGLLIEKISGMDYREYVQKHVFSPAGMSRSGFFRLDRVEDDLAEGCDPLRDEAGQVIAWKKNIYAFPPIGSPDSGAHVTARDLDRFLRTVKAGGLLSPDLTEAFFTPQVHHATLESGEEKYGYGLEFLVDQAGGIIDCGKSGINAGVSGLVRYYPSSDINIVLLSNMESGVWKPSRKINDLILGGQLK